MILTTTQSVEGRKIIAYKKIITGEAILGANIMRDLMGGIRDIIGGRAGSYEKSLREARELALAELAAEAQKLGADAVVGVDLDYEVIGEQGSMMMVSASGTAVSLG